MTRPPWWFWTVYVLMVLFMFAFGATIGILAGINPYISGTITAGVWILRVTYQAARGNFYVRWWDHS